MEKNGGGRALLPLSPVPLPLTVIIEVDSFSTLKMYENKLLPFLYSNLSYKWVGINKRAELLF